MTPLLKKFSRLFKGSGSLRANPARDWLILLGTGLALLVLSVLWNVWFLNRVAEEGIQAAGSGEGTLNAYETSAVRSIFDARATTSAAYRDRHLFIDPSR